MVIGFIILAILDIITAILYFFNEKKCKEGPHWKAFRNGLLCGLNLILSILWLLQIFIN